MHGSARLTERTRDEQLATHRPKDPLINTTLRGILLSWREKSCRTGARLRRQRAKRAEQRMTRQTAKRGLSHTSAPRAAFAQTALTMTPLRYSGRGKNGRGRQ